jgi:hypothetical protein
VTVSGTETGGREPIAPAHPDARSVVQFFSVVMIGVGFDAVARALP